MRKLYIFPVIVFFATMIIFISCKKNISDQTAVLPAPKSKFTACNCNNPNEYIKGEFDGVPMCFSNRWTNPNDFENINYVGPNQDQLNMIRQNTEARFMVAMFWSKSKIWVRSLPYILPRPDWDTCEGAEIQLLDMNAPTTSACQFCLTDGDNFLGHSGFGPAGLGQMKYMITENKDDTLSGTFHGIMKTMTGHIIKVENGAFRVGIIRSVQNGRSATSADNSVINIAPAIHYPGAH